jgi:hypothetical protein
MLGESKMGYSTACACEHGRRAGDRDEEVKGLEVSKNYTITFRRVGIGRQG